MSLLHSRREWSFDQWRVEAKVTTARDSETTYVWDATRKADAGEVSEKSIKTLADAQAWLRVRGVETEMRTGWLSGTVVDGPRVFSFTIGRSSGGGMEASVRLEPSQRVFWFLRDTTEAIAHLLIEARTEVEEGRAVSWLEALRVLDPQEIP